MTYTDQIRKEPTISGFKEWVNRQEDVLITYRHAAMDMAQRYEEECKREWVR